WRNQAGPGELETTASAPSRSSGEATISPSAASGSSMARGSPGRIGSESAGGREAPAGTTRAPPPHGAPDPGPPGVAHSREDGQADDPLPQRGGLGQVLGTPPELLLVVRMEMERAPVHGAGHAFLPELVEDLVAIQVQAIELEPDHEQVPGVHAVAA